MRVLSATEWIQTRPSPASTLLSSTAAAAWSIFGTGFTIPDAVGINDSGQILCNATNASGNKHAVLLTRNRPEPQAIRERPNPAGTEGKGQVVTGVLYIQVASAQTNTHETRPASSRARYTAQAPG